MEQTDVARVMAHFDRELLANTERYRAIIAQVSAQQSRRHPSTGKLLIFMVLSFVTGAVVFGAAVLAVWALEF